MSIKECPYCNCDQIQLCYNPSYVNSYYRYCRNCRLRGPLASTAESATDIWNNLPRDYPIDDIQDSFQKESKKLW